MNTVPVYIAARFVRRFIGFFEHWYVGGARFFWKRGLDILGALDATFAVPVTLKHLFEPLYQDRTVIGYILGFIFRTLRVLIGLGLYVVIVVSVLTLYLLWATIPIYFIYQVIRGLTLI